MEIIVDVAKIMNGFPEIITQTPIKNPSARDPASPIRTELGNALCHKYPIKTPAIAKEIAPQLAPVDKCGTKR